MEKGIILDDKFRIEKDVHSWILIFREEGDINEKTGKPIITSWQTYHVHLKDALASYIERSLSPNGSVPELIEELKKLSKWAENKYQEYGSD